MRKVMPLLFLLVILPACSLHISGLQDAQGKQVLYVFDDEHEAFAAAYEGIVSVIPDSPVKAVSGAMRGYTVAEKNLISSEDESAFTINILPGTGIDSGGTKVRGYFVEVSVKDEAISSRLTAKKIYRAIVGNLERDGVATAVGQIRLGKYQGGGFLRGGRERVDENGDVLKSLSITEELAKLHQLFVGGGLTQQEYDKLKAQLLKN